MELVSVRVRVRGHCVKYGMEWNELEWNGMEWIGLEWNRLECSSLFRNQF